MKTARTSASEKRPSVSLWIVGLLCFGMACIAAPHAARATEPAVVPPIEDLPDLDKSDKQDTDKPKDDNASKPSEAKPKQPEPAEDSTDEPEPATDEAPAADEPEPDSPQVEIYIPSVARLTAEWDRSDAGQIARGLAALVPSPEPTTDDELDAAALLDVLEHVWDWPDTSIAMTTYTIDREGRPRWAVRFDWPLQTLVENLQTLLDHEAARSVFEGLALQQRDDAYELRLPDWPLAILKETDQGSMILSNDELRPPPEVFGQDRGQSPDRRPLLIYCQLNLTGDEGSGSLFSKISGVRNIRYGASVRRNGEWDERFQLGWNPFIGMALKQWFVKTERPFNCPDESFFSAAFHLGMGDAMADAVCGLPPGTIGARADGEMALSVVPGNGFLPVPDLYYQFHATNRDKIVKAIRKHLEEDRKKRRKNDEPPAWYEEEIDGSVVFWRDPSADARGSFLMPVTYRTVVFFDGENTDDKNDLELIVCRSGIWAEDTVRRWQNLRRDRFKLPSSDNAHWQARISWRRIYEQIVPYLTLSAAATEGTSLPPPVDQLDHALGDGDINIRVELAGLRLRHRGPVPVGVLYVPAVTAASIQTTADRSSEAARERTASRQLRVLYHHARLFKNDFGRWPANVAELDGYIDFASHPGLLSLRSKERSFVEGLAAIVTANKKSDEEEADRRAIDDSLYTIEWAPGDDWKLKIRDGEFVHYKTIYIDAQGDIHRVPKDGADDEPGDTQQARATPTGRDAA